jgi:uncharacterized protein YndB with AHSA1/START domain
MRPITRIPFLHTFLKVTIATAFLVGTGVIVILVAFYLDEGSRIYTVVTIERPVDEVYDYVTTPGNWPKWHPASLKVSGATDHSLEVGEQVTEEFTAAGHRGLVVWTVVDRNAPRYWAVEGKVQRAESGGRITYTLSPNPEGTTFEREFVYRLPTVMFYVANKLKLERLITEESDEALRRLEQVLEAPRF